MALRAGRDWRRESGGLSAQRRPEALQKQTLENIVMGNAGREEQKCFGLSIPFFYFIQNVSYLNFTLYFIRDIREYYCSYNLFYYLSRMTPHGFGASVSHTHFCNRLYEVLWNIGKDH